MHRQGCARSVRITSRAIRYEAFCKRLISELYQEYSVSERHGESGEVDQMLSMGVPSPVISHVLHHTGDMRGTLAMSVYRTYDMRAEKLRALRLWQARLHNIVSGRKLHTLRWIA